MRREGTECFQPCFRFLSPVFLLLIFKKIFEWVYNRDLVFVSFWFLRCCISFIWEYSLNLAYSTFVQDIGNPSQILLIVLGGFNCSIPEEPHSDEMFLLSVFIVFYFETFIQWYWFVKLLTSLSLERVHSRVAVKLTRTKLVTHHSRQRKA